MATKFTEDGLQNYLNNISDHRVLTKEEEVELFQKLEAGDEAAREEILRCNLRLVVKIALQFKESGLPVSDLIQEGNIGLIYVISKFDWRKGFRFSTYAAFWIRQEIQAAIRNNNSMIRLPIRKARLLGKIAEAVRHFNNYEGRDPSNEEVALFVGTSVKKIESISHMRESMVSLDAERNEDGTNLFDAIPDSAPAPSAQISESQSKQALREALSILSDREKRIMELRYGLNGGPALSLRKTSKFVGLSQEGVRRIEHRALQKLRRPNIQAKLDPTVTAVAA